MVAAERARIAGIYDAARKLGLDQAVADTLVRDGITLDAARGMLIDQAAERDRQVETRPHIRTGGLDEREIRRGAVETALLHRFDPHRYAISEPARDWRGYSLIEMARSFLEGEGVRVRGLSRDEIATRALHTTSDFPAILAAVTNKTLRDAYEAAPRTFPPIARRATAADFKDMHRLQLGEAPQLEKVNEAGEFKRGNLGEGGHPQLITPVFFRHLGTVTESLAFEMGRDGPANGTVQLVAQGEEKRAATIDAGAQAFPLKRFSQGRGFIARGSVPLAGVTGGSLTFSNNLDRVRVIRDDGKIEAAEPTIASCTGAMTVRFDGATSVAEAANGEPVVVEYGFTMAEGWSLMFELFRVFLPKPKYAISGPGGVEASFDWRAAYDEASATMLRARLLNDVASYA